MVNLNLERYGRMLINGTEVDEYRIGNDNFEKAVDKTTAKSNPVSFRNTRVTGGDDVSYPAFQPLTVMPSLKAFGADPTKIKAEKLWGRYVPVYNFFYFLAINNIADISTAVLGDINSTTGEINTNISYRVVSDLIPVEVGESYMGDSALIATDGTVGSDSSLIIAEYDSNKAFISGTRRVISSQAFTVTESSTAYVRCEFFCSNIGNGKTIDLTKSKMQLEVGSTTHTLVPFGINKFVKDIGADGTGTDFGYFNEETGEFVKVQGASGELIQPIKGVTNGSNSNVDTGLYANDNMEMFVRFKAITGSFYIFQARNTGTATIYGISGAQNGNTINAYGITSNIARTAGHIYTVKMTMVNRAVTLYVKDETTGTEDTKTGTASSEAYSFPSPTTIKLFGDASKVDIGVTVYDAYIKVNGVYMWQPIPVRIGTAVEMLDILSWQFATRTGTFTAGTDIPYTQLCPDIIKLAKGELKYGFKYSPISEKNNSTSIVIREYSDAEWIDGGVIAKNNSTAKAVSYDFKGDHMPTFIDGHKYYVSVEYMLDSRIGDNLVISFSSMPMTSPTELIKDNKWHRYGALKGTTDSTPLYIRPSAQTGMTVGVRNYQFYDLTAIFGAGNEPTTASQAEAMLIGLFADGTHKVTVGGVNLFDMHYDVGYVGAYPNITEQDNGKSTEWIATADLPDSIKWIINVKEKTTSSIIGSVYSDDKNTILNRVGHTNFSNASFVVGEDVPYSTPVNKTYKYIKFYISSWMNANRAGVFTGANPSWQSYIEPITKTIEELLLHSTDYKDLQSGDEVHNWGVKILDGTENWADQISADSRVNASITGMKNVGTTRTADCLCSHFEATDSMASRQIGKFFHYQTAVYIYCTQTSVAEWKAYLAEQYAKGTPVIVLYPLANPTTTPHTATPIALNTKATRVVTSEAELPTTNQVTYLGREATA